MEKTRHVPTNSALKELLIPVQAKLAAAWTSLMFLVHLHRLLPPLPARRNRRNPGWGHL